MTDPHQETPLPARLLNPAAGRIERVFARWLGRCQFLRFGLRDRIIRRLHPPDTATPEPFEIAFYGLVYPGNLSVFLDWSVFYYGAYASQELRLMSDFVSPLNCPVIIDAGANIGHHTLFASTIATHVHAFEPFPPVALQIHKKIARNGLTNITVHPVGLGERTEQLPYSPPDSNNTGTGSFQSAKPSPQAIKLSIVQGSAYLAHQGIESVDFLKIDVEGFEVSVLKGFEATLSKCRPVCFFEWSQSERGLDRLNGPSLFPPDYLFFEFHDRRVIAEFFQSSRYTLRQIDSCFPDGNLLAVPTEYAERNRHVIPALDCAMA